MRRYFFFLFYLFASSCGSESNRLYGSMSQIYPLSFDHVQLLRVGSEVSIEYQRLSGGNLSSKVAKLTVHVGDLAHLAGNDIDLTETVSGLPRGTLQRVESSTTDFPLKTGTVHFDQEPQVGTHLSGSFHTTLAEPMGRTLNGDFQGTIEAR
jgi:hypothetical protein